MELLVPSIAALLFLLCGNVAVEGTSVVCPFPPRGAGASGSHFRGYNVNASYDYFNDFMLPTICTRTSGYVNEEVPFPSHRSCSARGVLKINTRAHQGVIIDLVFNGHPQHYAFNIGGSFYNNGRGGSGGRNRGTDGEFHFNGDSFEGFTPSSTHNRPRVVFRANNNFFSTRLIIIIKTNVIIIISNTFPHFQYLPNHGMFDFSARSPHRNNHIFLGLNRVIFGNNRFGSGLCAVAIKLLPF